MMSKSELIAALRMHLKNRRPLDPHVVAELIEKVKEVPCGYDDESEDEIARAIIDED